MRSRNWRNSVESTSLDSWKYAQLSVPANSRSQRSMISCSVINGKELILVTHGILFDHSSRSVCVLYRLIAKITQSYFSGNSIIEVWLTSDSRFCIHLFVKRISMKQPLIEGSACSQPLSNQSYPTVLTPASFVQHINVPSLSDCTDKKFGFTPTMSWKWKHSSSGVSHY